MSIAKAGRSRRSTSVNRTQPHKHRQSAEPYARPADKETTPLPAPARQTKRRQTTRLPSPPVEDATFDSSVTHVSSYLYGDDSRSILDGPAEEEEEQEEAREDAAPPPTSRTTSTKSKPRRNSILNASLGLDANGDEIGEDSIVDFSRTYKGAPLKSTGDFTILDSPSLRSLGWSESEMRLFDNIRRRAMLPLFPHEWIRVFPGLPRRLFPTPHTDEEALLQYVRSPQRAVMVMERLMKAGVEVRTKKDARGQQSYLSKLVKYVYSWAFYEANTKASQLPRQYHFFASSDAVKLERVSNKRMRSTAKLARDYKEGLFGNMNILDMSSEEMDSVPEGMTIYGVAVCGGKVALMTLNSEDEEEVEAGKVGVVKTHIVADFGDPGMDVWNAASVALHAVQLRDELRVWREWRLEKARRDEREASVVSFARVEEEEE
ncbi:hypothetical protein BJ508DRAFT_300322 [Ascobolus immersus RN42]|uniref:Uncharacterized protein n=1 Tax=Ascobolus immersus RN42 TaxID=1160509 RepID=A0A3N4IQ77_ASCIM|nr:hypothetical protein BJ508DRAFT_300322 [Ascobolus immersus RN42]